MKPGVENTDLVSNLDYAETFLDLAGAPVPADMQGRSIVPILKGEKPADWRTSFYYHYYELPGAHSVKKHYGIYDGRYKLIHFYDDVDDWELIDLEKDPLEMKSYYDDPEYAAVKERLQKELERQIEELKVPKEDTIQGTKYK